MKKLLQLLREIKDGIDYEHETKLVTNRLIDSFDVIQIISMLDDEYDISVPASQIVPENFNSAQAIYNLIQRLSDN